MKLFQHFSLNMQKAKFLVGSLFLMLVLFIWKFNSLPVQIPLFYSRAESDDRLTNLYMIFILPVCLCVLFILNQLLLKKFFRDNLFIEKIIYYLDLSLIVLFTFIFIKIIFLVT